MKNLLFLFGKRISISGVLLMLIGVAFSTTGMGTAYASVALDAKPTYRLGVTSAASVNKINDVISDHCSNVFNAPYTSYLPSGGKMFNGDCMEAANGKTIFAFQTDGNLVVYNSAGTPLWSSRTYGKGGNEADVQDDGNFVIYQDSVIPLWATNTSGHGYTLVHISVQNDGNVVLYPTGGGRAIWATHTVHN